MRKWLKRAVLIIVTPILLVVFYLLAALIGAIVPSYGKVLTLNGPEAASVYLTGTMLHQDIAIPINEQTLKQFSFLGAHGFPLDHPELQYLIVGWGARDFYTQTADYVDIKFDTVFTAVTGDNSVMHIGPARDVSVDEDAIEVQMSEEGFSRLLEFIEQSFLLTQNEPIVLEGKSFGGGDLFFEGVGDFNIFHPCNVWVSQALVESGVNTGVWTPTAYSLKLALYLHNS